MSLSSLGIWLMVKKNGMPSNKALPLSALVLYFIPNILLAYGIDPAYSQIITGALTIFVVLVGGLLRKRTGKT